MPTSCRICTHPAVERRYHSRRHSIDVGCCAHCGAYSVTTGFTDNQLREHYSDEGGFSEFASSVDTATTRTRHIRVADDLYRQMRRKSAWSRPDSKPRLFDIGAGSGAFLAVARDRGFHVEGNEYSRVGIRLAQETWCIGLTDRPLDDIHPTEGFDAVTLWGVLEHVNAPAELIAQAANLLSPGGLLFLYTPRLSAYDRIGLLLARATRGQFTWFLDRRITRTHLQLLPDHTLLNLLRSAGLDVLHHEPICEYNLPPETYLASMGVPNILRVMIGAVVARLIASGLFFRNNARIYAVKRS